MPIEDLPIITSFNVQRFTQYGSEDCANWYSLEVENTKKIKALYPAMGRKHVTFFNENKLVFTSEASACFKSINYAYYIVGTAVIAVDRFFNTFTIGNVSLGAICWFDYLTVNTTTYCLLTDGSFIYLITENAVLTNITMQTVTDINAPDNPTYVKTFGNRFVVSEADSPLFFLTDVNLDTPGGVADPTQLFTVFNGGPLFASASAIIRQMAVLHNQLYLFFDFNTDIWANIPQQITIAGATTEFPFKLNTSYNFDYGIADPKSLSVGFGMMAWLARNQEGTEQFMISEGQKPVNISTQAINVLLENSRHASGESPYLLGQTEGFLYQWENTVFYRVSAGTYQNFNILDYDDSNSCVEYNFSTKKWDRAIELNGEKNRIRKHIYFNNKHLVTVENDPAVYEMAGNIYYNETRNTTQPNTQALDAFRKYPIRYELVTRQIFMPEDYAEFVTDYIEIDFVFGFGLHKNDTAFANTIFIITEDAAPDGTPVFTIAEDAGPDGTPVFLIMEEGNTPTIDDNFYNTLFNPAIGLFFSDDGGISYFPADVREFSKLGDYQWRMRWYELGPSRNRCYKLIAVSSVPIAILGAVQNIRRASGGAN